MQTEQASKKRKTFENTSEGTPPKPPQAFLESYKLYRNLRTKLVKASRHTQTLSTAIDKKQPPSRLLPRIKPVLPTLDCKLITDWEIATMEYAIKLTTILKGYWERYIPELERKIQEIEENLKNKASDEDFNTIQTLVNKLCEKHNNPEPQTNRIRQEPTGATPVRQRSQIKINRNNVQPQNPNTNQQ